MTMDNAEDQAFLETVAKELNETDEKPISQVAAMIEHMGRDWVQTLLDETKKIEADGGMKIENKKRRRTIGGVFFYVGKGKLSDEDRQKIFPNFGNKGKVVAWEERHEYVDKLIDTAEHGKMRYATVKLNGRPGEIIEEDHTIITTMTHTHKKTPTPKGVPHAPETPTIYTIYMSRRHWSAVSESILEHKSDRLIVEGSIFFDAETETIAVFAQKVKSHRMEKEALKNAEAKSDNKKSSSKPDHDEPKKKVTASSKLQQLHSAADKLRERITDMEAKGQRGVNMTKQLLKNTEKQIEVLEKSEQDK